MPFTWIRISADEIDGERVAALVAALELEPVVALGHLVALCGKVSQHRPDGDIRTVPPVLLERWAAWRGERGAFAHAVLATLCDPPGILREWVDTMGKLVALAEKDRRRKKVAYDRAREEEEEHAQLEAKLQPGGAVSGDSAEQENPLRGDSADSPTTRTYGRTDVRTNEQATKTGTVGNPEASAAGAVVDNSSRSGKREPAAGLPPAGEKPDPLAGLPPSAVRLLSLFYATADGRRKRDVLEQLRDTIDPARPGARLDNRTWVNARSVDELEAACAMTLRNPPRDLNLGVRWVLHNLTTLQAQAARQATEGTAAKEADEERRYAEWHRERAIEVSKWELAHPEESRDLLAKAELDVPNEAVELAGSMGRMVRVEHYAALVAERMKFPGLEEWRGSVSKPATRQLARVGAR